MLNSPLSTATNMSVTQKTHLSSLKDICRCCHSNGKFKSLKEPYIVRGKVEVYYRMVIETFGILINPPIKEASYTICDECIRRLRDSTTFRNQVEACEEKFNQYSQLFFKPVVQNGDDIDDKHHSFENDDETVNFNNNIKNADSEFINKNVSLIYEDEHNDDEVLNVGHDEDEPDTMEYELGTVNGTEDIDEVENLDDGNDAENAVDENGVQNNTLPNYLECRFCKKQVRECFYKRHLKIHVGKTECINCGEIFDSTDLLKEHVKKHKYENMFTCDFCKKGFIARSTLKRHIDLHHMGKGRKFMCHECGVFFNDITNLRAHTTTVHLKLRLFECSICKKKLASKKTLKVHMRSHTGERPYVCDECGDGFVCFTQLKIHTVKHNVMKKYGTKYVCKICLRTFHGQGLLTHHVRSEHPGRLPKTMTKRKYLPCPSCNKIFSQKFSLDRHITKHGVIDKVPCEICHKMLTDKFSLARHIRNVHTSRERVIKEKVQCSLCKRKVQDIENHMTVHTVRPMKCETCGKNYPDAANLYRHVMNVHLGVNKIFQCKKCDRRPYSRRENLRSHMLKKHGCDLIAE